MRHKVVTSDNWLDADRCSQLFVYISPEDGQAKPIPAQEWVCRICVHILDEAVPEDIRGLFETAKATMCFGHFHYPQFAVAMHQLYRVAEAAVDHVCASLRAPPGANRFARKVDWLASVGVLDARRADRWRTFVHLRNASSHPRYQEQVAPATAVTALERIAELINHLFAAAKAPRAVAVSTVDGDRDPVERPATT